MRTGVRDTPMDSTACSSEMRSPGRSRPDRMRPRSASCARTVCDTERSGSRSAIVRLLRCLHVQPGLGRDHPVDDATRPHRAGIDVDIVENTTRIFVDRALLRLEYQFV